MASTKPTASHLADRIKWENFTPSYNPDFLSFKSRRSAVFSRRGMVATSQTAASAAGLAILQKGGNAADAAVAAAAAINVTEPCNCGIGGDVFVLYYDAKQKKVRALNGSGRSAGNVTLQKLREAGIKGGSIPLKSIHTVTVPGSAAAWVDTVETFGSGKLTLKEILEPAIDLAEEGFPVAENTAYLWGRSESLLAEQSPAGQDLLINGKAPAVGEIFKNPNLGRTFRDLAEKGKKGFYEGRVAEEIVAVSKSLGGFLELSDLSSHTSTPVEPISYTYHDSVTLWECPPNGQGIVALIALGILDAIQESGKVKSLQELDHNGVEYLHVLVESLRFAFADAQAFVTDPEKMQVPVEQLLNKEYLAKRAEMFDPTKAKADVEQGQPLKTSDTVYFSTSDEEGNACSFIMSNYAGFGTGIVPNNCGFTLQNRGSGFSLDPNHPNCIGPNKRTYHTICPAMLTKGDELLMSYGVMGGFMQPQGHVQVLLNILHHGFHAQNALDAPRFCISAGMPDVSKKQEDAGNPNSQVFFEEGIDPKVVEALGKMGHDVDIVTGTGRGMFGRGQVIQRLSDPRTGKLVWCGGSDPRADGHAVPQI